MKLQKNIKATISNIIVALIYIAIILAGTKIVFGEEINTAISLMNTISIDTQKKELDDVKIDLERQKLTSYPEYGTCYGRLKIPSIDVDLPLYYGDTLSILKKGIGHSSGSYFPGEGGTIICAGHNYRGYIRDLYKVKIGDIITIETTYGTFSYKAYNSKIIKETALNELPLQKDEEILMLYTCYPIDAIGHPTKRLVVYAK